MNCPPTISYESVSSHASPVPLNVCRCCQTLSTAPSVSIRQQGLAEKEVTSLIREMSLIVARVLNCFGGGTGRACAMAQSQSVCAQRWRHLGRHWHVQLSQAMPNQAQPSTLGADAKIAKRKRNLRWSIGELVS